MKMVHPPAQDEDWDSAALIASLWPLRILAGQSWHRDRALPLPSRASVGRIVELLVAVLFPRHFGAPGLAEEGNDAPLIATLDNALTLLQEQIFRELYLASGGNPTECARKLTAAFAAHLPNVRVLLNTDISAALHGDPSAKSADEVLLCFPGVAAVIRHRLAHVLYGQRLPLLARIIAEAAHAETGIDIHPGASIGEGFFIDHGTGVVIGETAIIGRNVRLYQAVTLGAKRFAVDGDGALVKGLPRHPIVEDDVVIYAGATVLGRITIGRGSTIGGNVWLTHDVPAGSNVTQAKARTETFDNGGGI